MNKITHALALALAAFASTTASAQPIAGVLEVGATHSALFMPSAAPGGSVGYVVKNQSPAGKAILGNCLEGLYCNLENATTRALADAAALTFNERAARWIEVTQARKAAVVGFDSGFPRRR